MNIDFQTLKQMNSSNLDATTRKTNIQILADAGINVGRAGRWLLSKNTNSVSDYEKALYEAAHNFGKQFYSQYDESVAHPKLIPHLVDLYVFGTPIPNFVKQFPFWQRAVDGGLCE